jgi:prepilin-type N-terminal cleavage/methylation domain-containing protein
MKYFLKLKQQTPNYKLQRSRGFTLIELLIYMGILSIFIVVLASIFTSVLDTQISSQTTSSVAQDGRYIYTRLIYDINRAQAVTLPATLGQTTTSLQASISGQLYTYALSSGNLTVTNGINTINLNSSETAVSNLSFQRIGNAAGKHTFRILFTVTSRTPLHGLTDSENFQTTAGLR